MLVTHDRGPEPVRPIARQRRGYRIGQMKGTGIERHPHLGIDPGPVGFGDLPCRGKAPRHRQLGFARRPFKFEGTPEIRSRHTALAFDEGDEKTAGKPFELRHPRFDGLAAPHGPAMGDDIAIDGIEGGDNPLARQFREDFGPRCGAEDDLAGSGIEPAPCRCDIADSTADAARRETHEFLDQPAVVTPSERRVEVDDGNLAGKAESLGDRPGITGLDGLFLATE